MAGHMKPSVAERKGFVSEIVRRWHVAPLQALCREDVQRPLRCETSVPREAQFVGGGHECRCYKAGPAGTIITQAASSVSHADGWNAAERARRWIDQVVNYVHGTGGSPGDLGIPREVRAKI